MTVHPATDWAALRERLRGEVILPGEARMVLANKHFAAGRPLPAPQALIRCRDREDVRWALDFVREWEIPFAVRSGGHCFADLSSSAGAILDLAELAFCRREGERLRVGPGLTGGQLAPALAHADLALPTGGCPWVGIGGLCLVGGFGFLGRHLGLATDRVRALEVLTADGDFLECDATTEPELFWALRGAGGAGFGIVTSLVLEPAPLPSFRICFGAWPVAEAAALLRVWQACFANPADARISLEAGLLASDDPDEPCHAKLYGILVGSEPETAELVAEVRRALGPLAAALRDWVPTRAQAAGYLCGWVDHQGQKAWQPSRPFERSAFQFTRSQFFAGELAGPALEDCVRQFVEERLYAQARELELVPWGGAYARQDPAAAFRHRAPRCLARHTVMAGARSGEDLLAASARWVDGSRDTLSPHASGAVYQGYADWRLDGWAQAYYGETYPRLQAVKARYDPENLFQHAQSIRLPGS
jgi:FAD/FMN-containing dehydrogenase